MKVRFNEIFPNVWDVNSLLDECFRCVTSDQVKGADEETREEEKLRPAKKLVGDEDLALNIMESESIEAAVMDLEEQIVRIEWIKGMLLLNSDNSTWIYEDYPPPSS